MVIGLLTLTSIPVVTGVAQALSEQRRLTSPEAIRERKMDAARMAKFYIDVYCDAKSSRTKYVHGRRLVLRDGRVWIDEHLPALRSRPAFTARGFFLMYPDEEVRWLIVRDLARRGLMADNSDGASTATQTDHPPLGLVSQVQDDPPLLNWLYVDRETMELRYGNRSASRDHLVGPWDWTDDRPDGMTDESDDYDPAVAEHHRGLTLEGHELFVAVEDPDSGEWQVYFDRADNGLEGFVAPGRKRLEISLERTLVTEDNVRGEGAGVDVRNTDVTNIRGMTGGVNVFGNSVQENNIDSRAR